jgi:hypothetical protein
MEIIIGSVLTTEKTNLVVDTASLEEASLLHP